jgi:hypothetical protein
VRAKAAISTPSPPFLDAADVEQDPAADPVAGDQAAGEAGPEGREVHPRREDVHLLGPEAGAQGLLAGQRVEGHHPARRAPHDRPPQALADPAQGALVQPAPGGKAGLDQHQRRARPARRAHAEPGGRGERAVGEDDVRSEGGRPRVFPGLRMALGGRVAPRARDGSLGRAEAAQRVAPAKQFARQLRRMIAALRAQDERVDQQGDAQGVGQGVAAGRSGSSINCSSRRLDRTGAGIPEPPLKPRGRLPTTEQPAAVRLPRPA